ncbi:MAG: SAM-dependent methyltransferase [Treponema sp.]
MILSVSLSKPVKNIEAILGRPYQRIKIRVNSSSAGCTWFVESFTEKQAFHDQFTEEQLAEFLKKHTGSTFKNCIERTDTEEITILANKRGEVTTLRKPVRSCQTAGTTKPAAHEQFLYGNSTCPHTDTEQGFNHIKNYLIQEGTPVPFLVLLGVMTSGGKVIASKYDKFRQINRFLEFIDDVLPDIQKAATKGHPVRIVDFGCGKSYLTFAVYYYLTEIKKIAVEITGLDLKKDVIDFCSKTAEQLGCKGLKFAVGNIAEYTYTHDPDVMITLHACDTATDYALDYAVKHNCTVILSVPCCQHELNSQINENKAAISAEQGTPFIPLLKYGIIKERFAALVTDALRAEYLENAGYSVQILEFIDMEHTPKNLLIRAVKKDGSKTKNDTALHEAESLTAALHVSPALRGLLKD